MPTALVTGANGFIGSHLVRELLHRNYHVRCLVRHTSDITSIAGLPVTVYVGDVRHRLQLSPAVQGVDYIFHLAAALMATSWNAFEATNVQGTKNLLEAAVGGGQGTLKRFLLVSSQAAAGPAPDMSPLDETAIVRPISWYGRSKKMAEDLALEYNGRIPVTIVRPSSVYGEREKDISQVFSAVHNRIHAVLGLQTSYAVMVYVGDVVKGIVDASLHDSTINQTYFLNHSDILTKRTIVKTIAQASGKHRGLTLPIPILALKLVAPVAELIHEFTRERPKLTRDKTRELAHRFWLATPKKARADFNWEASTSLHEGMRVTYGLWQKQQAESCHMPLEPKAKLWMKYVIVAILLGALVEVVSSIGGFYAFYPWYAVFGVVFICFGLVLGTISWLLRCTSHIVQILVGTILAAGVEVLNELRVLPAVYWEFATGWPFGITNPFIRSVILGCAGGIFVVIVNTVLRRLYKRRLRLG